MSLTDRLTDAAWPQPTDMYPAQLQPDSDRHIQPNYSLIDCYSHYTAGKPIEHPVVHNIMHAAI